MQITIKINDEIELNYSSIFMPLDYEIKGPNDFILRLKSNGIEAGFIEKNMIGTITFPTTLDKKEFEIKALENDGEFIKMICMVLKYHQSLETSSTL